MEQLAIRRKQGRAACSHLRVVRQKGPGREREVWEPALRGQSGERPLCVPWQNSQPQNRCSWLLQDPGKLHEGPRTEA